MNAGVNCLCAALLAATPLGAVEPAESVPELAALQQRHQQPLDQVAIERTERFQNLQAGYLRALEDLRRSLTAQGNLDAVLIVRITLNDQTYESDDFPVTFSRFYIRLWSWQPDNHWLARKVLVR